MRINLRYIFFWLVTVAIVASCNKSLVETSDGKGTTADTLIKTKKALLILIDGAVGSEYRALALPTLKSLEQNSIFSYDGLNTMTNEYVNTDQSWSNIMTGVTAQKHNVTTSISTNNFTSYPPFIKHLKDVDAGFNVTTIAADSRFSSELLAVADEKFVYPDNDAEVNTKAKTVLQNTTSEMIIVHFNSPNLAGLSSTFTSASATYAQAAQNVDGYIKQQIDALKSRTSFSKEDWVVMIVSSVGSNVQSTTTPWNAFEDKNHNTLYFFYNPRFQLRSYTKPNANSLIPYIGSAPLYNINGPASTRNAIMESGVNTSDLDFGTTGSFTVQCKVKMPTGTTFYPGFFGKRANFNGSTPGWLFFLEGNGWGFNVSQGGGNRQVVTTTAINDNKWHTLTGVVEFKNNVRTMTAYTDGIRHGTSDITNWNLNSPSPVTVGWIDGSLGATAKTATITDVRIYNIALSDAYISSNYCRVDMPDTDPYYPNLLGFWPSQEVWFNVDLNKYFLWDHSSKGRRLMIGDFVRSGYNDSQFGVCPPLSEAVYNLAPHAVDVANQVFSWFGVPVRPSWNLDGKAWVPSYSDTNN